MPVSKQAKKRVHTDDKKRQANKVVRSAMRTAEKAVHQAATPEEAQKALPHAMKKVDKAAKKNIIHANAAARKKSQLSKAAAKK